VFDVSISWLRGFPPELIALLLSGQKTAFDAALTQGLKQDPAAATLAFRMRPFGFDSSYDVYTAV
jgi:hypothetical protein